MINYDIWLAEKTVEFECILMVAFVEVRALFFLNSTISIC